jgi:hypothetical protein
VIASSGLPWAPGVRLSCTSLPSNSALILVTVRGASCERDANIRATTRVHARVTYRHLIPQVCGTFVAVNARACPRFPPQNLHGKEGVDGSSPSEGLQNPRSRGFCVQNDLLFLARAVGMEPFMELPSTGIVPRSKSRPSVCDARHFVSAW